MGVLCKAQKSLPIACTSVGIFIHNDDPGLNCLLLSLAKSKKVESILNTNLGGVLE